MTAVAYLELVWFSGGGSILFAFSFPTEGSHSRFPHLPTFRQHRRNSSHPNFSFLKKGGDNSGPTPNHTSSTTTSPTPKTPPHPLPPSSSGSLRKMVPSFLRAVSPRLTSSPSLLRKRQRNTDSLPRLQATQLEGSAEPGDLLHQYQFQSLGCCAHLQSYGLLRKVLSEHPHNTEAINYKLSYQREPM